jgi:hypothetical protein
LAAATDVRNATAMLLCDIPLNSRMINAERCRSGNWRRSATKSASRSRSAAQSSTRAPLAGISSDSSPCARRRRSTDTASLCAIRYSHGRSGASRRPSRSAAYAAANVD